MPKDLQDFPRPPHDNGRGLHGSWDAAWSGGEQRYDYWVKLLTELNIKWFKVLDDRGNSIPLCEKLLNAGIFPIVRILRRDPPPNDTPEPNPGHLGAPEEQTVKRLIQAGVRYFETNNEPNLNVEWKHQAIPGNPIEAAKLVALSWLFDARLILSLGGYPGLPAISGGGEMDLMGALVTLGRQDILLEGCWIALHNYSQNRPLNFPDDPVNRSGQRLTPEQYNLGTFKQWAWWDTARGAADIIDEINELRANTANATSTIQHDHACFREFEHYNALAVKYVGRSIPIISTEGGYRVGHREDLRYPRVTPAMHCEQTVAMYDFMQRQAPDYYFAATPATLIESDERLPDAWHSDFWQRAFKDAPFGFDGIPSLTVPNTTIGSQLPVIDAVKQMQNLARRLPGTQPAPPSESAMPIQAPPPPAEKIERQAVPAAFPSWLRDEPAPTKPIEKLVEPRTAQKVIEPAKIVEPPPPSQVVEPVKVVEPPPPKVVELPAKPVEKIIAPPPPPPPPPPPEQFVPLPSIEIPVESVSMSSIPDELEWDWRLNALGVEIQPAEVKPGQAFWKLVRAEYLGPGESNDEHQIYYTVVDQQNNPMEYQKVLQTWTDGATDAITNEHGETDIPLWAAYSPERGDRGTYAAWVDGLSSDRVVGMGLPNKRHVSFRLTWKRSIASFLDAERGRG